MLRRSIVLGIVGLGLHDTKELHLAPLSSAILVWTLCELASHDERTHVLPLPASLASEATVIHTFCLLGAPV